MAAPRSLKASGLSSSGVTLQWSAPKGAKPAHYVVLRDGKQIAKTSRTTFTDHKVKAGSTYRYAVRAFDAHKRAGALTRSIRVTIPVAAPKIQGPTTNTTPAIAPSPPPAAATPEPSPAPSPSPTPTSTPTAPPDTPPDQVVMTAPMVERLFWRAGFGPSRTDRAAWTGKTVGELVDWFLTTPVEVPVDSTKPATDLAVLYDAYYASLARPPLTSTGEVIDPLASDTELELEWIDRIQRAVNPFPERLAFFWHRHWAISRDDGIPNQWILNYRNRMLRYSDFGRYPTATFRQFAVEMTTGDTAMSMYLNLNQNIKGKPNENYAREFMELFCLGPSAPDGTPNYSQTDVAELAKAFTGWVYNGTTTSADYGKTSFTPSRFEMTKKTLFTGNPYSAQKVIAAVTGSSSPATATNLAWGPDCVNQAVDIILGHANHPQFLIRKLWAEFVASAIPQATLDTLVAAYRANGFQLKPLLRAILTHPLVFESIAEPNLIKAPMVYILGALRQFDAPLKSNLIEASMNAMQQKVYFPPNVAGWEGGLSWLNTNTVQGRFDLIARLQQLKYSTFYTGGTVADVNYVKDTDLPANPSTATAAAWVDKALDTLNAPWISAATKQAIVTYAATPITGTITAALRRQRLYVLQALILGGPDGQVM